MEENKDPDTFTLTCERGERKYVLHVHPNSPLGEMHDVLYEMLMYVIDRIKNPNGEIKPNSGINPDMEKKNE